MTEHTIKNINRICIFERECVYVCERERRESDILTTFNHPLPHMTAQPNPHCNVLERRQSGEVGADKMKAC